ncbi:uncharacterized protein LOC143239467 isoform X1 [Tachypleus tridentatus]|uniref:uncharacterized protein LOC143239467 isoform X1 n=1 Tax=Tachypleus tridentatus TaxID=6853 RepID=UPI003FD31097
MLYIRWFCRLLLPTLLVFVEHNALHISELSIPRWVENGTQESVTLDCVYTLTDKDNRLVVKWFLNNDPKPIYQWIPELGSRLVSEKLQGRIDMNFSVTPFNKFTEYRSLRILNPTTHLSGKYACHVASFNGLDTAEKEMIVYAPAKCLRFNYTKSAIDLTTLSCEVGQIFPVPEITLYRTSPGDSKPTIITDTVTKISDKGDTYRAVVTHKVRDTDLPPDGATLYECVILFPGAGYRRHKSVTYYPGGFSSGNNLQVSLSLYLTYLSVVFLL